MPIKLFDSELKVMEALWRRGPLTAGQIAKLLADSTGWNRNTTYTVIKKCIEKGAIRRSEPGFLCTAVVPRAEIQQAEADELINKMFDGSAEKLFVAMLSNKRLSQGELERLKKLVDDME